MYQYFFNRLYNNAYSRSVRIKKQAKAKLSITFTVDGNSFLALENGKLREIQNIKKMADFHKPESILAELVVNNKKTVYNEDFNVQRKPQENLKNIQENSNNPQTNQFMEKQMMPTNTGFTGFGQVSVDEYINRKLDDDRKERKLNELELELSKRKDEIQQLNQTIAKLESGIGESEKEVVELQGVLESKQNIRYWAGLTGDILESIGVKKESLREPLAGLIASEESPNQLNETAPSNDSSGIVEENTGDDKRSEIISLIQDYLSQVDDTTLSNIFMIFSEIEQDKELSTYIIEQINNQKRKNDAII